MVARIVANESGTGIPLLMNVVQAMVPMMKYRPRAATIATYSQSGRPLGRRWSCICLTSVVPGTPIVIVFRVAELAIAR